ncbi:MAG: radical SAM protein [Candidatus Bathyarchaeia archaeon]|nr:radical SAM protein [Candidatus Bathyarchaeota archaeon]
MRVLNLFDPWRNKFCFCPVKYSLSPYTGCAHKCLYCYITSYIPNGFNARVKKDFFYKLKQDIKRADKSIFISIANSSDPYQPLEERMNLTRETLKLLLEKGFKVLIVTKSSLVSRDVDVLKDGEVSVSLTVTSLNEDLLRILEPYAPSPKERVKALKKLSSYNISCSARIDPLIPGLNDNFEELENLVKELVEAGVKHIVASTYKIKPDNFLRVTNAFPELKPKLKRLYFNFGESIKGVRYLPKTLRFNLLLKLKNLVEKYGLTFSICREGFTTLNSSKSCDGSHLITNKFKYYREGRFNSVMRLN